MKIRRAPEQQALFLDPNQVREHESQQAEDTRERYTWHVLVHPFSNPTNRGFARRKSSEKEALEYIRSWLQKWAKKESNTILLKRDDLVWSYWSYSKNSDTWTEVANH